MTVLLQPSTSAAAVDPADILPGRRRGPSAAARRRYLGSTSPWQSRDANRSLVLAAVGFLGLGSCWYGAGSEISLRDQVPWFLGSLLMTALIVLAGVSWITVGLREVRQGLHELAADKQFVFGLPDAPRRARDRFAAPTPLAPAAHEDHEDHDDEVLPTLYAAAGMSRAHVADCLLLRGKDITEVRRDSTTVLCGVCQP